MWGVTLCIACYLFGWKSGEGNREYERKKGQSMKNRTLQSIFTKMNLTPPMKDFHTHTPTHPHTKYQNCYLNTWFLPPPDSPFMITLIGNILSQYLHIAHNAWQPLMVIYLFNPLPSSLSIVIFLIKTLVPKRSHSFQCRGGLLMFHWW